MKLLITGVFEYGEIFAEIEKLGFEIYYQKYENDELVIAPDNIEAVICNNLFLYHNIELFSKLKFIQLTSTGFDRVPLDYIIKKEITIYNANGVYSKPIAEYVISSILSIYKDVHGFYKNQKNHLWIKNRNLQELTGKNIAILGLGSIGKEIARKLSVFDCIIYGFDIIDNKIKYIDKFYNIQCFEKVSNRLDIVICCLPLTNETKGYFNYERLSLLNNVLFINVSRGEIVDKDGLIRNLKLNKLSAVLDVFENEPLNKESEYWGLENLIITPHNSFVGNLNKNRLVDLVLKNLIIEGEK